MIAVIDSFTINVEKHGSFSPPSPKKIDAAAKDHLKITDHFDGFDIQDAPFSYKHQPRRTTEILFGAEREN